MNVLEYMYSLYRLMYSIRASGYVKGSELSMRLDDAVESLQALLLSHGNFGVIDVECYVVEESDSENNTSGEFDG